MAVTPPPPSGADEMDEDLPPVDLTPRTVRRSKKRTLPVVVALVLVAGALGFIAAQSLGDASLFFYNADEAVAQRNDLGDRRFRLQGTVEEGSVRQEDDTVEFVVSYGGAEVDVVHQGDPPELFQPNIPVVLEGNWDGEQFASDRIMVKHTSVYEEDNPDRVEPVETPAADGPPADQIEGNSRPAAHAFPRAGRDPPMNVALGSAALLFGFGASVLGAVTLAVGLAKGRPKLLVLGRSYALMAFLGALIAFIVMERALITRDFTVAYVATNGSSKTPAVYNFATLWAALEGSILLWALILTGYTVAMVRKFRDRLTDPLVGWAILTMLVVCVFFFGLMVTVARPFLPFDPGPGFDGPGPNPLLQNHVLMAFHPPMLYLGYVGFTVPFAFAVAALATGRLGEGWLVETRRWTLFAWGFLTVGIILGAWWSYEVLGWGGYWAWDPVENASFLPWLTGTAYLHSVMVQERRGMLRVWNLSLLCATFSLTILGTFLTRSGVLDSVHAFTESGIGPAILAFFALTVAVTVGLIAWRGDQLRSPGRIDSPLSREGAFMANNLMFAAFAFVVLLGTVFPLLVEAVNGDRISVGVPYFNRMTMPIGLTLLFLMAVAPVLPWRKASTELLRHRLYWPAWVATATLVVAVAIGARGLAPLLAFFLGGFAAGAALRQIALASRRQGWRGLVGRANGGMIVHLGVVIIAVAFAASQSFAHQGEFRLSPGESATVAGHTVTYLGIETVERPEKVVVQARVRVDDDGVFAPALNRFAFGGQAIGTPSVRVGFAEDVYLALLALPGQQTGSTGGDDPATGSSGVDDSGAAGDAADPSASGEPAADAVLLRVIVQPMIVWLWIGGGVMAFGTILAAWPGRRRRPTDPVSAPVDVGAGTSGPGPGDEGDGGDGEGDAPSTPEPVTVGS